jgi:heme iron utilization protein
MPDNDTTRAVIARALAANAHAVLATEGGGQPHASFMAYAILDEGRRLVFATYRNTRKYQNLQTNPRVALLVDCKADSGTRLAVTAVGRASEVDPSRHAEALAAHAAAHPELADFAASADSALFLVEVDWFESAAGVDSVQWWQVSQR